LIRMQDLFLLFVEPAVLSTPDIQSHPLEMSGQAYFAHLRHLEGRTSDPTTRRRLGVHENPQPNLRSSFPTRPNSLVDPAEIAEDNWSY
jgi:hypothetical protein